MKPLDYGDRRHLFTPGEDPHEARFEPVTAILGSIGAAIGSAGAGAGAAGAAAAGTAAAGFTAGQIAAGALVAGSALGGLASTGMGIANALGGGPKMPEAPGLARSAADDMASRAAVLADRQRQGRASTILTRGLGVSGSSTTTGGALPPKNLLGV